VIDTNEDLWGDLPHRSVIHTGAIGTGFAMFPLKLAVLIPGIHILKLYRREGRPPRSGT